jgi:hypothetical protein
VIVSKPPTGFRGSFSVTLATNAPAGYVSSWIYADWIAPVPRENTGLFQYPSARDKSLLPPAGGTMTFDYDARTARHFRLVATMISTTGNVQPCDRQIDLPEVPRDPGSWSQGGALWTYRPTLVRIDRAVYTKDPEGARTPGETAFADLCGGAGHLPSKGEMAAALGAGLATNPVFGDYLIQQFYTTTDGWVSARNTSWGPYVSKLTLAGRDYLVSGYFAPPETDLVGDVVCVRQPGEPITGFFRSGAARYVGRAGGHYCQVASRADWLATGGPIVEAAVAAVPSAMVFDGPCAPPPPTCGTLRTDQILAQGQTLKSCDGRFALSLQGDGNLVLSQGTTPLWSTNTYGKPDIKQLIIQEDGNLVLYGSQRAEWNSQSGRRAGRYRLVLQEDGNLVIYADADGKAAWSWQTGVLPVTTPW